MYIRLIMGNCAGLGPWMPADTWEPLPVLYQACVHTNVAMYSDLGRFVLFYMHYI